VHEVTSGNLSTNRKDGHVLELGSFLFWKKKGWQDKGDDTECGEKITMHLGEVWGDATGGGRSRITWDRKGRREGRDACASLGERIRRLRMGDSENSSEGKVN